MPSISLISTPWPLFNRPSIQLGALKAFIKKRLPLVRVDTHHVYLKVAESLGYDLYKRISERSWLAEALYAALLYPECVPAAERFWARKSAGLFAGENPDFQNLCAKLEKSSASILKSHDWGRYKLAGFSICFSQLTSSLYFIRELKKRRPSLKIVVGGSGCAGEMGESLLRSFPEIDFVIRGEGELPLVGLIELLTATPADGSPPSFPGLISRAGGAPDEEVWQVTDLDDLPIPEYGDYFKDLRALGPKKTFLPKIPLEISRGCWWRKRSDTQGCSGCAFCNLNLQWHGYRAKTADRIIREMETLSARHQILSLSFMDNVLPPGDLEQLFTHISALGKDFTLFSEIRANTQRHVLQAMANAGMRRVQVGIEALSTSLLKKLNKGTTAIDNMEIMKNCEAPSLPDLTGNMILRFPSSDENDVAETLRNMEFAHPFSPIKGIPFWLGYGSPVWQAPGVYGLTRVGNHPFYKHFFPPRIFRGLRLMVQGYQGGVRHQARLWKPVEKRLEEWKRTYLKLHRRPGCDPILSYHDGGRFMIIRQRRLGDDMTHRLRGSSREIYLFCETQRPLSRILCRFPRFGEDKVRAFLCQMVDKGLMFNEGDRYLSLAVPVTPFDRLPGSLSRG